MLNRAVLARARSQSAMTFLTACRSLIASIQQHETCSDHVLAQYTLDYYLTMAEKLVGHGIHALAIKDMAGLLKPAAATTLVTALRGAFPQMPIHVHTHDTAGTGVATQLAAAAAGADIIDAAIDSMSGRPCARLAGAGMQCLGSCTRLQPRMSL